MYSPEFELLILSLRAPGESELQRSGQLIEENSISWDDMLQRAAIHCVRPQMAALVSRLSHGLVPDKVRQELDEAYRRNLLNQIGYISEFFKVRDLLAGAGIRMLPFKGFWLAQKAYGNISYRESLDVDVFVSEQDLGRIREIMLGAGYSEEHTFRNLSIEEIRKGWQEYNFDMVEEGREVFHIEFHWGICPPEYKMAVRLEDLSGQITSGIFQGRELEVFTPSAQLLLTILHHGGKDRFNLMKQVNDFAQIIKNCGGIDWDWLLNEIRRFNAEPLVYVAISLAASVVGIEVPPAVRSAVETGRVRRLAGNRLRLMSRSPQRWYGFRFNIGNWLFRMRTRSGLRTRLRLTVATARALFLKLGTSAK